jgi:hypothetical protein
MPLCPSPARAELRRRASPFGEPKDALGRLAVDGRKAADRIRDVFVLGQPLPDD